MIFIEKNFYNLTKKTVEVAMQKGDEKVIVFCEDKNTLAVERELCRAFGGSFNVDVTTLNRFYASIAQARNVCGKVASALIIKRILTENKRKFSCFSRSNAYSLSKSLFELISQLKSAKVSAERLDECAENFDGLFAGKIKDVALVYTEYEKFLAENNLYDGNNYLAEFNDCLKNFPLEEYHVIISGYASVTKQTASIFNEINRRARNVDFIALGGRDDVYTNEMKEYARSLGQGIRESEELPLTEYFFNEDKKVGQYNDKIAVIEYSEEVEEINSVCEKIRTSIVNGARYSDFIILAGNYENAKLILKKAFVDYEIPYYLEDAYLLSDHHLIKAVGCFLDMLTYKADLKYYERFLKLSAVIYDRDFSDEYLSYLEKNVYSLKDLTAPLKEAHEKLAEFEALRVKSQKALFIEKKGSVKYFCDKIRNIFEVFSVGENCEKIAEKFCRDKEEEFGEFCSVGLEKTKELLDELERFSSNEEISAQEFKSLVMTGAESFEISLIPQKTDCVYCGAFGDGKFRYGKKLFAIGLTSNALSLVNDTCIFTDSDLRRLDKLSVNIEPKIEIVNKRKREDVCVALTEFTQSAEFSYALTDLKGSVNVPSEFIDYIKKCYGQETVVFSLQNENTLNFCGEEEKRAYFVSKFLTKRTGFKNFALQAENYKRSDFSPIGFSSFFSALSDEGEKERARKILGEVNSDVEIKNDGSGKLFFANGNVSATVLESFFACPYKNFAANGLKLSEKEDGTIKTNEVGNILHSVLENFIKIICPENDSSFSGGAVEEIELNDEEIKNVVNSLVDALLLDEKYAKYLKKNQYKILFDDVKKEAFKYCKKLYDESKKSEFKPMYTELTFGGKNSKFKAIPLPSKSGEYSVNGKIDRVDKDGENNVRIIDYKSGKTTVTTDSGKKNFEDEALLYQGKKLQLYLYMNVLLMQGYSPAGVYYAPVNDDYVKFGDKREALLQGKTVLDKEILRKTDSEMFDGEGSSVIDVKFSKGEIKESKNLVDRQALTDYGKYARLLSGKAVDEIKEGVIIASPVEEGCVYCAYKGLCSFDKEKCDTTRSTKNVKGEELSDIVRGIESDGEN